MTSKNESLLQTHSRYDVLGLQVCVSKQTLFSSCRTFLLEDKAEKLDSYADFKYCFFLHFTYYFISYTKSKIFNEE
jgi:hypothetical protein